MISEDRILDENDESSGRTLSFYNLEPKIIKISDRHGNEVCSLMPFARALCMYRTTYARAFDGEELTQEEQQIIQFESGRWIVNISYVIFLGGEINDFTLPIHMMTPGSVIDVISLDNSPKLIYGMRGALIYTIEGQDAEVRLCNLSRNPNETQWVIQPRCMPLGHGYSDNMTEEQYREATEVTRGVVYPKTADMEDFMRSIGTEEN